MTEEMALHAYGKWKHCKNTSCHNCPTNNYDKLVTCYLCENNKSYFYNREPIPHTYRRRIDVKQEVKVDDFDFSHIDELLYGAGSDI